jgi:hypothetical protein
MLEAREDVERLFLIDRLPPGAQPVYDTADPNSTNRMRKTVPLIQLAGACDTKELLVEELRAEVVRSIVEVREKVPAVEPFTLVRAHEAMCNRDVPLGSFLIHPDFAHLCAKLVEPMFGIKAKLFGHHEVPYAEIYAMCAPDYLGVIPVKKGRPGVYRFSENVVWGRFQPVRGV